MASVNTNFGALVALQNLNATNKQLDEVQSRINTGLKVASAKDNGAVFAIAQSLRSRVGALSAVNEGLDRTVTNLDTAQSAGSQVSDILKTLQQTAERAKTFTSPEDRASSQADFVAARDRIDAILNAATVNGVNLLNGTNVTNALTVSTSDIGANSAQTVQRTVGVDPAASTTTATTLATTNTIGTGAASATNINIEAGDTVRIELLDAAGNVTQTSNINLSNTATIGALQTAIDTQTGGKVALTLDGNNLVYDADQNFRISFVAGGDPATATLTAQNNRAGFFTGTTGTFVDGDVAGAVTGATTSSAAQTGGGRQVTTPTGGLAAGTNVGTLTSSLLNAGQTSGSVTLTTTASTGISNAYTINLTAGQTLGQFLNEVTTRTNGAVTAAYDANSRQIVYKSAQDLTVANTNATSFGAASSTANTPTITRSTASSATATITGYDYRVNGGALAGLASLDLTTDPATASATIDTLAKALNASLSSLGAQGRALDIQKTFLTSLSDNIEKGIGSLVDADLAKESARLQSLQVKQQLGAQALSIANQGPQILLSFFR